MADVIWSRTGGSERLTVHVSRTLGSISVPVDEVGRHQFLHRDAHVLECYTRISDFGRLKAHLMGYVARIYNF